MSVSSVLNILKYLVPRKSKISAESLNPVEERSFIDSHSFLDNFKSQQTNNNDFLKLQPFHKEKAAVKTSEEEMTEIVMMENGSLFMAFNISQCPTATDEELIGLEQVFWDLAIVYDHSGARDV